MIKYLFNQILNIVLIFTSFILTIQYNIYQMRNSPINYQPRESDQSPYRNLLQRRSANKNGHSPDTISINFNDLDYWKQKAITFQSQNLALSQELLLQNRRFNQHQELQEKIQVLLAQNSHLADENQNLIEIIQQKSLETETWKSKFEEQFSQSNKIQNQNKKVYNHLNIKDHEHQGQIDKLLEEISRLHDQLQEIENLNQIEIANLKSKYQNQTMNQIQNLRRSQYGNTELQELNIRKLKDSLEEKNFQIQNLKREQKINNERLIGQIAFLQNETKKIQLQKEHQIDLIKTQNQNTKNNLIRAHKRNEEELKNLHQTKIRRLVYEIEQKKHQIQDNQGKILKGGKQNQIQINQMLNQKGKLRLQIKQNNNINQKRINQITQFYEETICEFQSNRDIREKALTQLYENQLTSLKEIIQHKEQEIQRLLNLNSEAKKNEQSRLTSIKLNNLELKKKIQQIVNHYERQIQLMKIKVSQLYEADLESLRSNMRNRQQSYHRDRDNLRDMIKDLRDRLANEVQQKIELRASYDNRLDEFRIKYLREHQQLHDLLTQHEKQLENQSSKMSLTHIEHNNAIQQQTLTRKQLIQQMKSLQGQLTNKNKQIEQLNLRIQTMAGFHKRQIEKLEGQITVLKNEHLKWVEEFDKSNAQWNKQRSVLKEEIQSIKNKLEQTIINKKKSDQTFMKNLQQKQIQIASCNGRIEELQSKCGILSTKSKLQAQNIEKTHLQTQSLMNTENVKFLQSKDNEMKLKNAEFQKINDRLRVQMQDIKKENEILRDNYQKGKIRQAELGLEITNLLESVNQKQKLEDHVINIGLSNNYFKNVAEIFKVAINN